MRRAGPKGSVSCTTTSVGPPVHENTRGGVAVELDFPSPRRPSIPAVDSSAAETELSSDGTFLADGLTEANDQPERHRHLQIAIRQRIESRLGGRVRNLAVRTFGATVVLEGQCATYYTKQLATHAAQDAAKNLLLANEIEVC